MNVADDAKAVVVHDENPVVSKTVLASQAKLVTQVQLVAPANMTSQSSPGMTVAALRDMGIGSLQMRATVAGVSNAAICAALDQDSPKEALIALLIER